MSWSLRISQGDLAFDGFQMQTVTGGPKLVQDLACCILEPMGTDPLHPAFGSIISGGTQPDGVFNPGVIGLANDAYAATFVDAEMRRICSQYQGQQAERHHADVAVYGKSTLTADEILLAIENIEIFAAQNHMLVNAFLATGLGELPLALVTSNT